MSKVTKDRPATENYVWRVVNGLEERMNKRFNAIENKFDKRFDRVITTLDSIAGQFKKFDEERVILSEHSKRHTDRIEKLEKKVFGAVSSSNF